MVNAMGVEIFTVPIVHFQIKGVVKKEGKRKSIPINAMAAKHAALGKRSKRL